MLNLDSLFIRKAATDGTAKAPPDRGAARFFYLAHTHFAKLIGLNMLFVLFCLPLITIPAALSGLNKVTLLLVREGTAGVWHDFFSEFKTSFLVSLPLGALHVFVLADAVLCLYLSMHTALAGVAAALMAAAVLLSAFTVLLGCYTFVLLPFVSLRNIEILRDALLLLLTQPKTDLLLLLIAGGGIAAAAWFLPYSVPVISVIWPALLSLAVCTAANRPIQEIVVMKTNEPH